MKKLLIIAAICSLNTAIAQDPHFSQYDASHLLINPANTGLIRDLNVTAMYRNQYKSVATPFTTSAVSFDMITSNDRTKNATLGVGVQFLRDDSGDANMKTTGINLNLSGIIKVNQDSKLSLGLMGGYGQRGMNSSDLRWDSQYAGGAYNPLLSSNEDFSYLNFSYFDAGAGIAYSFGKNQSYITANDGAKGSFGVSAFHFGLPLYSFNGASEKLRTKYVAHARVEVGQHNTNLTFIPSAYFTLQGNQKELLIGNTFRYLLQEGSHYTGFKKASSIGVGVNYRWMDAVVANVQLDYANYSIGFAYDFNVSSLTPVSQGRGGFELFLRFVTPNPFSTGSVSRFR